MVCCSFWQLKLKKGSLQKQLTVNTLHSHLLKKKRFFYLHLILIYWSMRFDSRNTYHVTGVAGYGCNWEPRLCWLTHKRNKYHSPCEGLTMLEISVFYVQNCATHTTHYFHVQIWKRVVNDEVVSDRHHTFLDIFFWVTNSKILPQGDDCFNIRQSLENFLSKLLQQSCFCLFMINCCAIVGSQTISSVLCSVKDHQQ